MPFISNKSKIASGPYWSNTANELCLDFSLELRRLIPFKNAEDFLLLFNLNIFDSFLTTSSVYNSFSESFAYSLFSSLDLPVSEAADSSSIFRCSIDSESGVS